MDVLQSSSLLSYFLSIFGVESTFGQHQRDDDSSLEVGVCSRQNGCEKGAARLQSFREGDEKKRGERLLNRS